jgi:hypothetical protein
MKKNVSITALVALASHTGAPGEQTCAASGCHDDNVINEGTAHLKMEVGMGETSIVPGKTYPIKINISDKNVSRFGFQLVVLDSKTQTNCGTLLLSDSLRTKLVTNAYKFKDRKYATYSFNGTDATSDGVAEWFVNWTAPIDLKQNVDFYVSAVSANDNMNDKGDKVYTTMLHLKAKKN